MGGQQLNCGQKVEWFTQEEPVGGLYTGQLLPSGLDVELSHPGKQTNFLVRTGGSR